MHRLKAALMLLVVMLPVTCVAQSSGSAPPALPYSFKNFPWWSDAELRTELKRRIPGLGDGIRMGSSLEGRIRGELELLLKAKGVAAQVQSLDPALDQLSGPRIPEAPPVSIEFAIAEPAIFVDKMELVGAPIDAPRNLVEEALAVRNKPYLTDPWITRILMLGELRKSGYLAAQVTITHGAPFSDGDRYRVPMTATVDAGPLYHVSSVSVDGGPLLKGRDLTPYCSLKPGDIAIDDAFGRLEGSLRSLYWHNGYADVTFNDRPSLDEGRALASYQFKVEPGPQYHLRALKIENLSPMQEEKVKEMLGLKAGDIYDEMAIDDLYKKLHNDPLLNGYSFSFGSKEDHATDSIDLTLSFFKQ